MTPEAVQPKRIMVIGSLAWSLVNFRGRLLRDMVAAGHSVTAVAPDDDPEVRAALAAMGLQFRTIFMERTAMNPAADLRTLDELVQLMRSERPDVVLAYTQKPIVYGGIACRITGVDAFHAMMSGLGFAFTTDGAGSPGLLMRLLATLYRVALGGARTLFVFNSADEEDMRRQNMVPPGVRVLQVPGSGIDIDRFAHVPVPDGPPVFLLVARLMVHKGLRDYAAAARIVKARVPEARFCILGPTDANPAGLPMAELDGWVREGLVDYLGETRDVRPFLAASTIFVLPSWYREGLPRSILEAMATGRAVVTTDAPGCRDAVVDGETGLLVPVRDPASLAAALLRLAEDRALVVRMGAASRRRAERHYAVERVNAQLLEAMNLAPQPSACAMQAAE
jgi:glycosyltransferase involved in cell wall biosynthesis